MNDLFEIILIFAVLIIIIAALIRTAIKLRRRGGSLLTTIYGATDEFYTKDQKNAIEHRVEVNANKKMEEEESGEPK